MTTTNSLEITRKLTRNLVIGTDNVVTDAELSTTIHKIITHHELNFNDANLTVHLSNYAVNNIQLKNNADTEDIVLQLPLSVENKSRNFYMRFPNPTNVKYSFVDCDGESNVSVESNVDLDFMFSGNDILSTFIFEVYELRQNPTTIYVGAQHELLSTDNLKLESKLESTI